MFKRLMKMIFVSVVVCGLAVSASAETDSFSATVTNVQGYEIKDCCDTELGGHYLFLTNKEDIANLSVALTGDIVSTSAGTLDAGTGTLTGAFAQSGDAVTLTDAEGEEYRLTVMQSTLPSVYIELADGLTLDTIHQDKEIKYSGNTVSITDVNGKYDFSNNKVEMKGRGNSSWICYSKKGYQIKFEKKQSILGMDKAKKWVLIANAGDETLMHNLLAYQLAKAIDMPYSVDFEPVDLWVNGEYRGNYILGEKVEIGTGRVELNDDYGTIFEQDEAFWREEVYNFYNEALNKHFVVKETNADEDNAEDLQIAIDDFQEKLTETVNYLNTANLNEVTLDDLAKYIDVDSFAKYYLVNEYAANWDSTWSSFYWYTDGSKDILHVGPVWDFDESFGNTAVEAEYYLKNQSCYVQNASVLQCL